MNANDLPSHLADSARLAALRAVALLDTPTEESFDRLTRLAARFVEAPIALVSLVDADRQFFKSCIGLPEPWNSKRETPLSHSFCQHNRISGQPLLIKDAREDPLFKNNLAVRDLNVVAYLGIPLVTSDGYVLGSFCVIDSRPRPWTEEDVAVVRDLALAVMTEIQLRTEIANRHKTEKERDGLELLKKAGKEILQCLNEPGDTREAIRHIIRVLRKTIGFDVVGIRLQDGDDFPYCSREGFPKDFLLTENTLIERSTNGGACRDQEGNIRLECTCGLVISGKTEPGNPLFTVGGSFWTNDSSVLLKTSPDHDLRLNPPNQCIHQDFASVALIPIRTTDRVIGLIQLNDRRKGRFSIDIVEQLEVIGSHIGAALMRKRAEERLEKVNEELEERIRERTLDLIIANERMQEEMEGRRHIEESLAIQRDLHSMLRESNEVLLLGKERKSIIHSICETAVKSGHFSLIWAGIPDGDGKIEVVSFAGISAGYLEGIEVTTDGAQPSGQGPTGTCLRTNRTIITNDFAANPAFAPWRERAGIHGLQSSIALPIRESKLCIGVFTLYSPIADFFTDERVALLEQIVGNLSSALDRLKAEESQKQMIDSLQLSEERYRIVADNTYDWEFWVDQNGKYIYVSPACQRITGRFPEEFMSRPDLMTDILHPDDIPRYLAHRQEARKNPAPGTLTFRILRPDGCQRWIEHACQPVFGGDGRFLGSRGSNRDITERMLADELLRQNEEKYRTLFNNSEIAMFRSRLDGSETLDCNQKFLGLVGKRREQVLGKPSSILWADPEERGKMVRQLVADGGVSEFAFTLLHEQKGRRNCVTSLRLYREQGILEGSIADITERGLAEVQILQSKKRLQAVFDGIPEPLILLDGERIVQMVNMAAVRYFRLNTPQDIIGRPYCSGKDCSAKEQCSQCPIPASVSGGKQVSFIRDGYMDPERVESVTIFPIATEYENGTATVIRIHDITEARMMEKSLLRTEKLASIGILSSGIAHEINNPNNFIMFNIPVLRRYLGAILPIVKEHAAVHPDSSLFDMSFEDFENDLFDLTDSIEKGSERIKNIVAELKDFSSLGDQEETAWGNPEQTITQAIRISRVQLKNRVNHLDIDIPKDLPEVFFQIKGLEQVIVNLLINAAQAADKEEAWISMKAKVDGEDACSLVIEIADNGCGMDEKNIGKIFDPFFTTKPPGIGTGLGLYVCHNLMEKMGGRIDVTSHTGEGSTFRIILPCRRK